MIVFLDTETTGLFNSFIPKDDPAQPHIVQLAAMAHDENQRVVAAFDFIIKPDGWNIPDAMAAIHGIDNNMANRYGLNAKPCLMLLHRVLENCTTIVAHNADFDMEIINIQFARHGLAVPKREVFCTMKAATPIVNLPPTPKMIAAGFNKPKAPKLGECMRFFFNEELEGAHNAQVDLNACARVYYYLKHTET